MLEDITMEKKLNRSVTSPKGIVDTKKNQVSDGTAAKVFPKSSRKREKPNAKVEQLRKPSSSTQKTRQYGKKTTSRSYHRETGGTVTELAAVDDDFDLKRSKKQNIAHLLNIQCKPRENAYNVTNRSASRGMFPHSSIRSLMSTQKHKYNKEQFLQANCQFVVRDDTDYSVHMADADILVEWNRIEQIRVSSFEPVTCPICLDIPSAGKITRCGHVYCWSCILHYLALTDQSWHKCPICYEAVHKKDLKSVQLINQQCFNTGQEIAFQLMKREYGSTISVPVLESNRVPNTLLSVSENVYTTVYSKLLLADNNDVLKIIENEEIELKNELKENEGCPELCFVEQATTLLNDRKMDLLKKMNDSFNVSVDHQNNNTADELDKVAEIAITECEAGSSKNIENNIELANHKVSENEKYTENHSSLGYNLSSRIRNESVSSSGDEVCTTVTAEDLEINTSSSAVPSKQYFFYQAMDGQQIFLHSLNVRLLEKEYGSLEQSPTILISNIIEIETGSMTDELRKRLRYLDHLPSTCQFQVVEIDLQEPIISVETRTFLKDQLEKRCRMRQKKAKEEKRMEKRAEVLTRKQYGCHSPPRRLRLDSLHHFPQCSAGEPSSLSPRSRSPVSSRTSSPASSKRSVSPTTSLNALSLNNNTFAEKLKDTRNNGGWKKRAPTVSESEAGCSHSRNLISDAVEAALLKARLEKEGEQTNGKSNKKKRKKQKPIPLCSMGMVYENP